LLILKVGGDGEVSLKLFLALVVVGDQGFEFVVESFLVVEVDGPVDVSL